MLQKILDFFKLEGITREAARLDAEFHFRIHRVEGVDYIFYHTGYDQETVQITTSPDERILDRLAELKDAYVEATAGRAGK